MGRQKARDNAFKCIYQISFVDNFDVENVLRHCYEENENTESEKEYISKVVFGVTTNLDSIDEIILKYLKNWTIERIFKIDLAILRVAIYEILYMDNIPYKVSVNEAVELAKEYGNNDSKSFVNGLLAKVIEGKVDC
jgi:N utilization substance protein B